MKKAISTLIGSSLLATGMAFGGSVFSPAFALPDLQLDILGGTYDKVDESVFSNQNAGEVFAYCQNSNKVDCLNQNFFLSIAIIDNNGDSVGAGTDFGSFDFGGTTYSSSGLTYGTPSAGTDTLGSHGIFDTLFKEIDVQFAPNQTRSGINVEDDPGTNPLANSGSDLYYKGFNFNVSGLAQGYRLHFDLYNKVEGNKPDSLVIGSPAPFSHDAYIQATNGGGDVEKTPEPGTTAALGLLALGSVIALKKRKGAIS